MQLKRQGRPAYIFFESDSRDFITNPRYIVQSMKGGAGIWLSPIAQET